MKVRVHPIERPVVAEGLRVPGDKSISHRALLLAALAEGRSRIVGLAPGADVRSTAACLRQLGVVITSEGEAAVVEGVGLDGLRAPSAALDCGNSGTTMRLLCGILAGAGIEATLVGDESLSRRPMERVAAPLRQLGARIETHSGKPPVRVRAGHPLRAGAISSAIASAQVKSAVLLAGLFCNGETRFTEPARSRNHTEQMLRGMGVEVGEGVRGPARLSPLELTVPGDLSSAAFLIAIALAAPTGSRLSIDHVGVNPTRTGFLEALEALGAPVEMRALSDAIEPVSRLSISSRPLQGATLAGDLVLRAIDEVPVLAVLAALAEGPTTIRDAGELRVKESDRLAKMAHNLRAIGARVEELHDGLRIEGGAPLMGGVEVDAAHDHRIALSMVVAALACKAPVTLSGAEWVDVSFPGFFDLLRGLGARAEILS